jgi:hypothetical protein
MLQGVFQPGVWIYIMLLANCEERIDHGCALGSIVLIRIRPTNPVLLALH